MSTFQRENSIFLALLGFILYLVHEFLAVLYHKLDRGVLELLGVVEVGQDQALQAGVHGQVVTQRLLARNQCHNVRFKLGSDWSLSPVLISDGPIPGGCHELVTSG